MNYFQQGDVLLKECEKPSNVEQQETDLLWKGENHHHRVRGSFKIVKDKDGNTFLHSKGSELFHEEHKSISIPEGFYQLGIVQEYSHFDEESKNVVD